jgi:hypothetical protein
MLSRNEDVYAKTKWSRLEAKLAVVHREIASTLLLSLSLLHQKLYPSFGVSLISHPPSLYIDAP